MDVDTGRMMESRRLLTGPRGEKEQNRSSEWFMRLQLMVEEDNVLGLG